MGRNRHGVFWKSLDVDEMDSDTIYSAVAMEHKGSTLFSDTESIMNARWLTRKTHLLNSAVSALSVMLKCEYCPAAPCGKRKKCMGRTATP